MVEERQIDGDVAALAARLQAGERSALAQAITLVESRKSSHQALARALMRTILPVTGGAIRVGITGIPGVGKSTLIDTLGTRLTQAGRRVAVLAVDPSSTRTGGSILGDKTRMVQLANEPCAFVRPSPTGGTLGGVAAKTREAMLLCEAAGFDVIIVETVGIGQSETAVADMTDVFVLLVLPGAGDQLQGIKKGIVELADLIAVNKADDNPTRAEAALAEYRAALHVLQPASPVWSPPVLTISGLKNEGIDRLWAHIEEHRRRQTIAGGLAEKRRLQQIRWMWSLLEDRLRSRIQTDQRLRVVLPRLESEVGAGRVPVACAVEEIAALLGL
jgi:LAO/AO transport system kinase